MKRDKSRSGFDIDYEGAAGEVVFAKLFKLDKKQMQTEGKKREDFLVDGVTIDVKTSSHQEGQLTVPYSKKSTKNICDYYCLVTGEGNEWHFRGFASKGKLFQDKNFRPIKPWMRTRMYCLTQEELDINIPLFSNN
jgi:hypothetical protein